MLGASEDGNATSEEETSMKMEMETDSHMVLFCVMQENVQVCQGCNLCSSYDVNSFRKHPNSVFCKLV